MFIMHCSGIFNRLTTLLRSKCMEICHAISIDRLRIDSMIEPSGHQREAGTEPTREIDERCFV